MNPVSRSTSVGTTWRFRRRAKVFALATGVGAVLLAGAAWAAIPDPGTYLIHGCYLNTTGALRVIDPSIGQFCASTETALNWNQHGRLTWKGNWSSTVSYAVNDTVVRNGTSFRAKAVNTNSPPPSSNWAVVTSAGTTGPVGATGAAGAPGDPGPAGTPGVVSVLYQGEIQGPAQEIHITKQYDDTSLLITLSGTAYTVKYPGQSHCESFIVGQDLTNAAGSCLWMTYANEHLTFPTAQTIAPTVPSGDNILYISTDPAPITVTDSNDYFYLSVLEVRTG